MNNIFQNIDKIREDKIKYFLELVFPKLRVRVGNQNGLRTSFHCVVSWQIRMHDNAEN